MAYIKPYDVAVMVTRAQSPIHIGHENNINTGLAIADRMIVLVGSAQESGTERNPFDIGTRMQGIKEVYGDSILVHPLSDLTNEKDVGAHWGKYFLDQVKFYAGKIPDVLIFGDEDTAGWFGTDDLRFIRLVMPRSRIPFSATKGRELMLWNQEEEWQKWHNIHLHKHFSEYRDKLLRVPFYKAKFEERLRDGRPPLKGWSDKGL